MTLPDRPDHRRFPADSASCSALAARLHHEAATLSGVLDQLGAAGADRTIVRELHDVIADLEVLAQALQRHVDAQARARRTTAERALSTEGRGRHALLRVARRVRRVGPPSSQYRGEP